MELIGLGLIGPFIALLVNNLIDGFVGKKYLSIFGENLTNNEIQNLLGILLVSIILFKAIFSILILRAITLFQIIRQHELDILLKTFISLPYDKFILNQCTLYLFHSRVSKQVFCI